MRNSLVLLFLGTALIFAAVAVGACSEMRGGDSAGFWRGLERQSGGDGGAGAP